MPFQDSSFQGKFAVLAGNFLFFSAMPWCKLTILIIQSLMCLLFLTTGVPHFFLTLSGAAPDRGSVHNWLSCDVKACLKSRVRLIQYTTYSVQYIGAHSFTRS